MSTESTVNSNLIYNAFGDGVLYDVNRDAFNREGSSAVFQRQFGERLRQPDHLYVVVGTDSGLLAEWILREELPDGTRYLFVEPDYLVETIRERLPQVEDMSRVHLTTPEQWKDLASDFQFQDYAYLDNIRVVQSIGAADAYLSDYRSIHWELQGETKEFVWQIEFQLGSQAFVMRQIENIGENRTPAICLQDVFKGKTAVLLGGGPSLDELIPWVKNHRDRVAVIAVSRICRRLLEADLQPDIVVSIDPHSLSFDVSKEMLAFDNNTLLIHSFHVSPPLLSQWHGPAVYFGQRLPWKSDVNVANLNNQGPTVTNTALSMAVHLGFSQVLLGGVDLCYSREGHTHASGSNERNAGPLLGNVGIQVETNGGWMADTRHSFASAVEIMGNQAGTALEKGCRIVNPAAGAARIPNVEHRQLDDIELADEPFNTPQIINTHVPNDTVEYRKAHYQAMLKAIAHANGRLRAITRLADEALECNDGLFGRSGKTADFKYKKRMDKIEKKLDREYKDISPLVKQFGSRAFLRLVRPDRDRDWSDEDIEKWGRTYYEIYKGSASSLLELLEAARERVLSRLDEEQDQPDITHLARQWDKDKTPGRARVWQLHHPMGAKLLDEPSRQALQQRLDRFEQVMHETETEQAKWCKDNYTLDPVRSKLQILFQHHDRAELARTAQELEKQQSTEAGHLLALANGYIAEIDGDPETAMAAYQGLIDYAAEYMEEHDGQLPRSRELEDALRRMSGIAIGHREDEQALMLMDVLTTISPTYSPQYAELLKLTGDLQGAVDTYSRYLEMAPQDFGAMLKLGKIFAIAGSAESASWAYNYVLEKDPGNQAAQTLLNDLAANG